VTNRPSYREAGVDIEAGDRAVELMRRRVAKASRPEVIGDLGGFAGLFSLDMTRYRRPLLASSTDGVGTKLMIAQALDRHDTVGFDLVGMVVDDLVVCGAEPLFMLDYVACGKVVPERMADIVGGIAEACQAAGCALIGGETAEHPGMLEETSTTWPAPVSGWSRPMPCWAASGSAPATSCWPCRPPACTPTDIRWSGTPCCVVRGCGWTPRSTKSAVCWATFC
jgi:phosphoribosylformylglycinamidine cyclo-ligase